jgi:hypothetical protein
MVPARHGIVDAAFFEGPLRRKLVDALEDPQEKILGDPDEKGVSPRKILVPTLPEWMIQANPRSRAVALGSGRFSSLLHAGHVQGDVYWYSVHAGRYVTSSYYRQSYPGWLDKFNAETLPRFQRESTPWEDQVSEEGRTLSAPDSIAFEADHVHVAFPHRLEDVVPADKIAQPEARQKPWPGGSPRPAPWTPPRWPSRGSRCRRSPWATGGSGLSLHRRLAGGRHRALYGPLSREQLDNLLKLDRELGEFFDLLDRVVGRGNTSWRSPPTMARRTSPRRIERGGRAVRRLTEKEIQEAVDDADKIAAASPGTPEEVAQRVADRLNRYDFVADAMTAETLASPGTTCDPFTRLFRNSYRADRVPRFPLFSFSHEGQGVGRYGVVAA